MDHIQLLYAGMTIGATGFVLLISALIMEIYIYENEPTDEKHKFERIIIGLVGEICLFIGFALINISVVKRINDNKRLKR